MDEGNKLEISISANKRLEAFVKEYSFKELFSRGIMMHLTALKRENLPNEEEKPDIKEAIKRFEDLNQKIETGFKGYVFRQMRIYGSDAFNVYFSRPEDLQKENHSRLDLEEGQPKKEYVLTVRKRTPISEFSASPETVIDSRGYQVEILRQIVGKDENEYPPIWFKRQSGFEFTTSLSGGCIGRGTKYDGITTYETRRTYEMGDLSDLTCALNESIKNFNLI